MNFAGAASQKMKVMKEGGEKSLELAKLGKELVEKCPPLLTSLAAVVAAAGAVANGDSDAGSSLKDALFSFKDAVKDVKDTTDQIKTIIKELQELLGDDAKDSKFGKVITKFLTIVDATENVLIKCGDLIEEVDNVLAGLSQCQFGSAEMKKSFEDITKCGMEVKEAVGELKDAITGDNDKKDDKSPKEKKEKPKKKGAIVDQPNGGSNDMNKKGTKDKQGQDDDSESSSCWACCCCSCCPCGKDQSSDE